MAQKHMEALDDPDEIVEYYRRIIGHLERITLNANPSIWGIVDELKTEARLRQISPTTFAQYNSAKSREIQRRGCTPETRTPELGGLLDWTCDRDGENVYWMNGMAGTGKTTIAYSLCTGLEKSPKLDLVAAVDALGECENEDSIEQILDLLFMASTLDLPVRFLLSNRPDPEIYSRIMSRVRDSLNTRLILHDLDAEAVKRDIESYLQVELENVGFTPKQLAALVERADLLFTFAPTAARYIKDGLRFWYHEKRLNMILGVLPPSTDRKARDIDTLYSSMLSAAIETQYLDGSDRELVKMLLDTIICAQEPMLIESLAGLLGLQGGQQVNALMRPLCSAMIISETSGLVTALHVLFPDFMPDPKRSSFFYCNPKVNHSRLAKIYRNVIKFNDSQFNICGLESSYVFDNEVAGLSKCADRAVSLELFHACRYWVSHITLGNTQDSGKLIFKLLVSRI